MIYVDAPFNNISNMRSFSISDLERYSGIKAQTIRTWEQRYGVLQAKRDVRQSRTYCLEELIYLLQLALLNRNGFKVSYLSSLTATAMEQKINQLVGEEDQWQAAYIQLVYHMHTLDIQAFERVLHRCFSCWSSHKVVQEVIYPFLKNTQLLWKGSGLTEEHLVVTIVRRKLLHAIEAIVPARQQDKKILLFLTTTSQLDLALLYTCFMLSCGGKTVVYMGNDVSLDNLTATVKAIRPQYLYTYLPCKNNFQFEEAAARLKRIEPEATLIITVPPKCITGTLPSEDIQFLSFDEALRFFSILG